MTEQLWELYRIIEWRHGDVFRLEYMEDRWVPFGEQPPDGHQYVAKSTSFEGPTIRTRKDVP